MKNLFMFFVLSILLLVPFISQANTVKINGQRGSWQLLVDNKPFYIKGVGCGVALGKNGEDYLKLAKEMGANTVRTWGTDQGTKAYLDRAARYQLMVDAGIWLNYADPARGFSYIGDTQYKRDKRKEVLCYIRRFKNHPAILMWNIGNEAIFFTKSEEEKIALCKFLESLIKEVRRIDPAHPIIYASAAFIDLPYLKKYVPSIDLVGMNVYGTIRTPHGTWDYLGMGKPYVVTEYAPILSQDSQKDINGKAIEFGDEQKAIIYKKLASEVNEFKGYNLGGFVFHLGETSQESMTWWNLNQGGLKRKSFWTIYEAYTGKKTPFDLPRIKKFIINKQTDIKLGELLDIEIQADYPPPQNLNYSYALSTTKENIMEYYVNDYVKCNVIGEGFKVKIKAPDQPGIYRLYVFVKDNKGNITSQNKTISISE